MEYIPDMCKKIVAILLLIFAFLSLHAQNELHLRHINTKGYCIRSIYCDVDGTMWFGTLSGLVSLPQLESRSPRDYERSFPGVKNFIMDISGDSDGRLWLKTVYNEMVSYGPKDNFFDPTPEVSFAEKGINVYREFWADVNENGFCWIWKDNRLYIIDESKSTVDSLVLADKIMKVRDNGSMLAVLTEKELAMVSLEDKKIKKHAVLSQEQSQGVYRDILVDEFNDVWLWNAERMFKYDYKSGVYDVLFETPSEITDMVIDGQRNLWVSTHDRGIFIYNEQGDKVRHIRHSSMDPNSLLSDRIERLYHEEDSGTIWIAYTKGGLSVWNPEYTDFKPVLIIDEEKDETLTDVLSFVQSQDSGMWIGIEDRGVYRVNGDERVQVLNEGSAVDVCQDEKGNLWAGLYVNGLVQIQPDGKRKVYFEGSSPFAIAVDKEGYVWVTLSREGVWRLDPVTGVKTEVDGSILYGCDMEYAGDYIYVASSEGCYVIYDNDKVRRLCEGYVVDICVDRQGYIWVAGGDVSPGLTVISPSGTLLPDIPGVFDKTPMMAVTEDSEGNIWAMSSSTLFLLQHDPEAEGGLRFEEFDINPEDLNVHYNYRALTVDSEGIMWIGTTNGYQNLDTRLFLNRSYGDETEERLTISAVTINDKVISPGQSVNGRVMIDGDIIYTRRLDLKYYENNVIVECSRSHVADWTSETDYYCLKGLSDRWLPVKDGTIVLSNLPAGTFRLMTCTKTSAVTQLLEIRVMPPLWKSWWAYLIYLMSACALFIGVWIHYRNKRAYDQRLRDLRLQQEQETRMNELKLRFFTNISHDLRTPLSLIIDPITEIMNQTEKPEHRSVLRMIHRNAEHLLSLVNQILDFRRLEFGKEKLMLSYGDIVSYVNDIFSSFRIKAEKEDIRMMFIPLEDRIDTMFDRDKVAKILMNLLSNAFKFTESGGYIHVQTGICDGEVVVSVKDSGIGINDEDKEHIFDRFYQVPDSRKQSELGSGVGLHIVREYVRLQGGEITVVDNPDGKGTLFRFTIPLKKQQAAEVEETVASVEQVKKHETTILVVDDNKDMLEYISDALSADYDVLSARNGAEALEVVSSNDVDIIVSDVMMPEIDGIELCRRIKNDIINSHIPVILLTAKSLSNDELEGLEAGADDYMTKPFSITILRQRIHNIIDRNRQHHQRFSTEINIEPSEITVTSLDEIFIAKAIAVVEKHMEDPEFSVEELSAEMGVHRSQLYKKLLHITGKKPLQFIRLLRLKRGRQLLEQSGMYVSEVAYKTGFNSPRFFSKYFKEEFGITPKEFQSRLGLDVGLRNDDDSE